MCQKQIRISFFFIFFFSPLLLWGTEAINKSEPEKKKEEKQKGPPKTGNFSLPPSQEPGPLIGFGEHVISKNQTQLFLFADSFVGFKKHLIDIIPAILYGVEDDFSIFLNVPLAASYKEDKNHSSGFEDLFLQFEYAFYTSKTSNFSDQATFVTNVTFPTGSSKKKPPTGFGSSSFFLGATFNRTYTDWFYFTSHGMVLTTSSDKTKFGNEFLYQGGLGKNIFSIPSELIVAWMVEVDGQYTEKNKIKSQTDPNSGGNTVYITPSLWISTKEFIVQLGFGLPAVQHLFGNQKKNKYLLAANFGWIF